MLQTQVLKVPQVLQAKTVLKAPLALQDLPAPRVTKVLQAKMDLVVLLVFQAKMV